MILVIGGAGFIGSNFVRRWMRVSSEPVLVVDALTYAGNFDNLRPLHHDRRFGFERADIADSAAVQSSAPT